MTTWNDKKASIITALKKDGFNQNKTTGNYQKSVPYEDSMRIATVYLEFQPKPNESVPVRMVNPDNLDEGPSDIDIDTVIETTELLIRTAINDLETVQTEPKNEQADPIPDSADQPATEQVKSVPLPPTTNTPAIIHTAKPVELTVDIVQQYINSDATKKQAFNFMAFCLAHDLDPFKQEAHLIIFKGKANNVIGVDGNVKRAQEQLDYDGYKAGLIVKTKDGKVEEYEGSFLLDENDLLGSWCKVYRKGMKYPIVSKVSLKEYIQMTKEGKPNKIWATKPATMIGKVSISQAHRKAYAGINGGGYEQIEMKDLGDVEVIE